VALRAKTKPTQTASQTTVRGSTILGYRMECGVSSHLRWPPSPLLLAFHYFGGVDARRSTKSSRSRRGSGPGFGPAVVKSMISSFAAV